MNKNATLVQLYRFQYVTYYTVKFDDDEPLGMQFLKNNCKHKDFQVLMAWIKKIGNDRIASPHYFRPEREASALPPPINITHDTCKLRWYCLRINYKSVILFNGGEKTANKAQDCSNVSGYFEQACKLSKIINDEFLNRSIEFDNDDLLIPKHYKFIYTF